MVRDGSAQPASPTILAGTPATVTLCGTGLTTTEPAAMRAMADLDVAEDLGAGADQHAMTDLGMTILVLLAGAAERHAVEDRDIVVDHSGLAADEAGGMIEEDAAADPRRRIDVGLEHRRGAALQIEGEILAALLVAASAPGDGSAARGNP